MPRFEDLEQQLKDQVKLNQRRMQEFERKSREILGVFKALTGYSFRLYSDNRIVRLKSIWAKDSEEALLFKVIDAMTDTETLSRPTLL